MAKYYIETPNPHFNGNRFGLVFKNGKATTDDKVLAMKMEKELGYTVHKVKEEKKSSKGEKDKTAAKANVKEAEKATPKSAEA